MGKRVKALWVILRTKFFALLLLSYWLVCCAYVMQDGYRLLVYNSKLDIERSNMFGSGIILAIGLGYSVGFFFGKARSCFSPVMALTLNLILTYMLFQFMVVAAR